MSYFDTSSEIYPFVDQNHAAHAEDSSQEDST